MNDSSRGAPQGAGYWSAPEMGGAPAGPAHDVHGAQQTRPMPIVPDVPDAGRDADDRDDRNRDAARVSGPLFRDEKPQEPMSTPLPSPPPKKRAGRDLRAAIGVGVGLGALVVGSLFIVKAVFVGVVVLAVVVGLWELTSRLKERKGINAPSSRSPSAAPRWWSPVTCGRRRAPGSPWRSRPSRCSCGG